MGDVRNIEIKSRIADLKQLLDKVSHLPHVQPKGTLHQVDIFYQSKNGRLKSRRTIQNGVEKSQLIFYDRKTSNGTMVSDIKIVDVPNFDQLNNVLTASGSVLGSIHKTRILFMLGRTRIHIDEVRDLGAFMELEVVMRLGEDQQVGRDEAKQIMNLLGIEPHQLLTDAYIDMLRHKS
jgi:predicted adenylyl cyclase CyaB